MMYAHADKNHIKISREYVAKIHCLRTLLSAPDGAAGNHAHTRDIPRIQNIIDEYVVKKP